MSKTHDELGNALRAADERKRVAALKARRKKERKRAHASGKAHPSGKAGKRALKTWEVIPYRPGMGREFYSTREWRQIRWKVLAASDGKCVMCGHSAASSGRPLHVDHIHARSIRPDLELQENNLQVLCEDCNLGKGSRYWETQSAAAKASPATPGHYPAPPMRLIKGDKR